MKPTIVPGDKVIVSKLTPGSRMIRNFFSLEEGTAPEVRRMKGFKVKRKDVLVFNSPYSFPTRIDLTKFFAKRCIGLPGDTIRITNGVYQVNSLPDTLGVLFYQQEIAKRKVEDFAPEVYHCFPHHPDFGWTVLDFGPLYIPKKGDQMEINERNICLYGSLITSETNEAVVFRDQQAFLENEPIDTYTFRRNYYFMAGDFIFDSEDSRYWGLLAEDNIVGKVAFVWNTKDRKSGKIRWDRFLQRIK